MASILDQFPFPWHLPEAKQLHENLVQLYPDSGDIRFIAQRAGLNAGQIFFGQSAYSVWIAAIELASKNALLRKLAEEVVALNPRSAMLPFFNGLLNDKPVVVEQQPRAADGTPAFINKNDDITEPEALLYYDDLTMQIGLVPGLIKTLQKLVELSPSICRLSVDMEGAIQSGTAFRIGENTLLTNWHVLHRFTDGVRAKGVTAEFGYEDNGKGGVLDSTNISCDVTSIVANEQNDWGTITATKPLEPAWPIIKLKDAVVPVTGSSAFIIQHPHGERKRVGFIRNQISEVTDRVIQYITDTQIGSSGSPVFDQDGKLIALHHAGGRPQKVVGKPPIKKNEGIIISKIIDDLMQSGVNIT